MAISFFLQITGLDVIGFTPFINHFLLELPNSRTQEYEGNIDPFQSPFRNVNPSLTFLLADLIGVRLMSRACYDPAEMVQYVTFPSWSMDQSSTHITHLQINRMFKRLEAATGSNRVDFLATHPSTGQRIKVRQLNSMKVSKESLLTHSFSFVIAT